jgi:hypothetical protein
VYVLRVTLMGVPEDLHHDARGDPLREQEAGSGVA